MQPKLRVGYYPVRDNKLALWIADEAKIFAKHGLEVELRSNARGQTVTEVISRNIDIGVVGFRAAVDALAAGVELVFVASLAANPFVFLGAPDIQSPQSLKGQKIWTARPGTGPDVATRLVLGHLQLNPERDVQLVVGGEHHFLGVQWLLEKKVVASLSNRSTLKDLMKRGHQVAVLADFIESGLAITAADVVMRRDWLKANRGVAKNFLRALSEATAFAKLHKEFTDVIFEKYLLADFATGMASKWEDYVLGVLPARAYPSTRGLEIAIGELCPQDSFLRRKPAKEFIDESLIMEIESEGFFDQLYL